MSGPAVKCVGLSRAYGATPAVRSVSFSVEDTTMLALLGPSGCGKTTTLRLIGGFEEPDTGTVEIKGALVAGPSTFVPPEKRRVGMVFQDYALFPHLNIRQNIAYGMKDSKEDKELLEWLIELVGLVGLDSRWPHELSGGEQQRVALARALGPKPDVVLLDEPFSNLDTSLRMKVRSDVRRILRAVGVTVIFVTHDQEEALSLADTVAVMFDGQVMQVDTPENLYSHPTSLRVASFLGEANILDGEATNGLVQCELGRFPYNGVADTPLEGPVKVLIRPEALQLELQNQDGPSAKVTDREYYGHDQMILAQLPSGQALRCRSGPEITVQEGDQVGLRVQPPVSVFARPN